MYLLVLPFFIFYNDYFNKANFLITIFTVVFKASNTLLVIDPNAYEMGISRFNTIYFYQSAAEAIYTLDKLLREL